MNAEWAKPLKTWKGMLEFLRTAKEREVWRLLSYELKHKRRKSVALRLYGRGSELRALKERTEMSKKLSV